MVGHDLTNLAGMQGMCTVHAIAFFSRTFYFLMVRHVVFLYGFCPVQTVIIMFKVQGILYIFSLEPVCMCVAFLSH